MSTILGREEVISAAAVESGKYSRANCDSKPGFQAPYSAGSGAILIAQTPVLMIIANKSEPPDRSGETRRNGILRGALCECCPASRTKSHLRRAASTRKRRFPDLCAGSLGKSINGPSRSTNGTLWKRGVALKARLNTDELHLKGSARIGAGFSSLNSGSYRRGVPGELVASREKIVC